MKIKIADTEEMLHIAEQSEKYPMRNRSLDSKKLKELLDPDGTHILTFDMVHNDVEVRTRWYLKYKGDPTPHDAWVDMTFGDFNSLRTVEASSEPSA